MDVYRIFIIAVYIFMSESVDFDDDDDDDFDDWFAILSSDKKKEKKTPWNKNKHT